MGPTASGKSALALALAETVGGEIVNADSLQVYRDLRILTARPTPEEAARVPHRLYGHVDAAERYSVGRWLADATEAIAAIRSRARTPILVGGTGLYFKALTEGLVQAPPASDAVRRRLEARLAEAGAPALHAALAARDPGAAARLSPNDAPRILRALSVLEETGRPLASFAAAPPVADWRGIALTPDRKSLYARIDARFAAMLRAGALDEARALLARGLDPGLPAMKAHGAPWLAAHLRGEIDLAEAARRAQQDTRRYAKRQFTWIAHQLGPGWLRLTAEAEDRRLAGALAQLDQP
jgi:tRNA dimethylallyltransferase